MTTLELKDDEAAVVFTDEGEQLYLCPQDDEDTVDTASYKAFLCIMLFRHEDLVNALIERVKDM